MAKNRKTTATMDEIKTEQGKITDAQVTKEKDALSAIAKQKVWFCHSSEIPRLEALQNSVPSSFKTTTSGGKGEEYTAIVTVTENGETYPVAMWRCRKGTPDAAELWACDHAMTAERKSWTAEQWDAYAVQVKLDSARKAADKVQRMRDAAKKAAE